MICRAVGSNRGWRKLLIGDCASAICYLGRDWMRQLEPWLRLLLRLELAMV